MSRARILIVALLVGATACGGTPRATTTPHLTTTPPASTTPTSEKPAILLFTLTKGFHHSSIPAAIAAVKLLGTKNGFRVDQTDDPRAFTDAGLKPYRAVVFLLTTGDVLDDTQQAAFERYIEHGGGYAGVHSASDTEYGWAWYGRLVGAFFRAHPALQRATLHVVDAANPSTVGLPATWTRADEWYNFRTNPTDGVHVLITVDEATYKGGTMGASHPIAWCHDFDGGRAWYTAMGHAADAYKDPLFLGHLLGGIQIAAGLVPADCAA
ncbi:MAG: ThuA domain-containing protein [Actinomycetota bacterium]